MGTQGTGRKRSTKKERSTAEDDALNLIAREAEARLAAKRAARAEAREIRMKELERQQKEEDSERYSRSSRRHTLSDEDERMSVGSRGSVRVEDRDYLEKGSRAASALTAGTLTSLGGTSSRRGSGETALTVDAESSIREIKEIHELKDQIQDVETKYTQNLKEAKDALAEVEEKYRKAMVSNAQLDNEKNNLMYQVDTLKDSLMELEELLSESRREYEEKVKEYEREKHAHGVLQFQFSEMKEMLKQSEELLNDIRQLRMKQDSFVREISDLQETVEWKDKKIGALERQKEYTDAIRIERDELREEVVQLKDILKKHGIVLGPDLNINGDVGESEVDGSPGADPASRSAQDSQTSPTEGNSMLEIRLRKLVDEREKMIEQVKKLKAQLEQKTQKNGTDSSPDGEIIENGNDPNIMELQRDSNRQISDLKFKLVKAEQEVTALEQNVTRLEGQVTRYKSAAENSEKVEDELKAEKRKLQRELRSALDKIDELESNNSHLSKRLEKMKSSRGMAQTP
uniref:Leucine rich repeat (in FLII) interacting protein 1a n=1 Tax=Amphiprion ocellaris TaxID=80972 RepID=A0A3Q1AW27_AMPOC